MQKNMLVIVIAICLLFGCVPATTPVPTTTPTLLASVTPTSDAVTSATDDYPCYKVDGPNDYRIEVMNFITTNRTLAGPNDSESTDIREGEVVIGITLGSNVYLTFPEGSFTQTSAIIDLDCETTHWMTATATDSAKFIVTRADADPTPDELTILTRDELPTKTWPDLEQYYACNNEERKDPKTSYSWELSLPLKAETLLYHSDPWTVSQDNGGVFTLNSQGFEAVFEVRSFDYTITVPNGGGIYRINFTTKSCKTDWLYVILPRDRNPLDFKFVVEIK